MFNDVHLWYQNRIREIRRSVVIVRLVKIEHSQPLPYSLAAVATVGNLHTVAHLNVFLAVGSGQRLRGDRGGNLAYGYGIVVGHIR